MMNHTIIAIKNPAPVERWFIPMFTAAFYMPGFWRDFNHCINQYQSLEVLSAAPNNLHSLMSARIGMTCADLSGNSYAPPGLNID